MGGRPMPAVLPSLAAKGVHIRRSEVTMIAGQPGAGKSLVALWHAVHWAKHDGLRGIYFSADSAELGQAARALAMVIMNLTVAEAEALLESEDPWAVEGLAQINNLFWSFEDDLSYENIDDEIEAFQELWGVPPDFIIVDNLTDVEGQAEDEGGMQRRAMKALTQLARKTDSAVIVLHHTSEDPRYKEDPCPPRSAIMFKVTAKPSLVITTSDHGERRPLAVVKYRYGDSDKSGRTAIWFRLDQKTLHWSEL